ncbi:hypothetical protein C8Q75DRAFT_452804 [Abortiporus biennis]|nr:hypothetical protein C8Q75DRAFT_452804 [Abortiporus biennis]
MSLSEGFSIIGRSASQVLLSNLTTFPPDTFCANAFSFDSAMSSCVGGDCCPDMPVTQNMMDFLNITTSSQYFQAYCLSPPDDDSCPFGLCPNGDIAGVLVRISTYVTSFCLSLVIFYSPEEAEAAFWSQLLTVYSLLITCAIAIFQKSLTRFHAIVAVVMAGSPLNLYLLLYSIVSFWYNKHRMVGVVGTGRHLNRFATLLIGVIWVILMIYIFAPNLAPHFAQASCDRHFQFLRAVYAFPLVLLGVLFIVLPLFSVLVTLPISLTILGWIIAIILQRKNIWRRGEKWSPRFGRVWSITGRNYSFLHFMTVAVIPTGYWISVIETGIIFSSNREFSLSFGQVLAVFVAIPPVISVVKLYPMTIEWMLSLLWVKFLRRRIFGQRPGQLPTTSTSPSPEPSFTEDDIMLAKAPAWPVSETLASGFPGVLDICSKNSSELVPHFESPYHPDREERRPV